MTTTDTPPTDAPQTSAMHRPTRRATLLRHLGEGEPLKVAIMGRLAAPARLVEDPDSGPVPLVQVVLHQHVELHPRVWPVVATYAHQAELVGVDPEHVYQATTALVASLPAGTDVVLLGKGLEAGDHDGAPCLRVLHVLGLRPEVQLRKPPEPDLFKPAEGAA